MKGNLHNIISWTLSNSKYIFYNIAFIGSFKAKVNATIFCDIFCSNNFCNAITGRFAANLTHSKLLNCESHMKCNSIATYWALANYIFNLYNPELATYKISINFCTSFGNYRWYIAELLNNINKLYYIIIYNNLN